MATSQGLGRDCQRCMDMTRAEVKLGHESVGWVCKRVRFNKLISPVKYKWL